MRARALLPALPVLTLPAPAPGADLGTTLDAGAAARFAELALACVHREDPNKVRHTMQSDADVGPPRRLTPASYRSWTGRRHYRRPMV